MSNISLKRENRLVFTLFIGRQHVELVQRLEGRVLVHEDVTLKPVRKGFGELVIGVGGCGNSDLGEEGEHRSVRRNGNGSLQM